MAPRVMRVRLHLRQVRALAVVVDTPNELVVEDLVHGEAAEVPVVRG